MKMFGRVAIWIIFALTCALIGAMFMPMFQELGSDPNGSRAGRYAALLGGFTEFVPIIAGLVLGWALGEEVFKRVSGEHRKERATALRISKQNKEVDDSFSGPPKTIELATAQRRGIYDWVESCKDRIENSTNDQAKKSAARTLSMYLRTQERNEASYAKQGFPPTNLPVLTDENFSLIDSVLGKLEPEEN